METLETTTPPKKRGRNERILALRATLCVLALCSLGVAHAAAWNALVPGDYGAVGNSDNAAPAAPANLTTGWPALIITWDRGGGSARTLSTPSSWTFIKHMTAGSPEHDGYVFCHVWQMGDTMPTINWGFGDQVNMQAVTNNGPTAPDCPTMLHNSLDGNGNNGTWPGGTLTITQPNTWVIESSVKTNGGTTYGTITCPSTVPTTMGTHTGSTGFTIMLGNCGAIQTTAVNITAANYSISGMQGTNLNTRVVLALLQQDAATGRVNPFCGPFCGPTRGPVR